MDKFYHSVRLEPSLCKGCINCIKRCPTEAIRVRGGKAVIAPERCIDCGECEICDLDPKKLCDNCGNCLDIRDDAVIKIDKIITEE